MNSILLATIGSNWERFKEPVSYYGIEECHFLIGTTNPEIKNNLIQKLESYLNKISVTCHFYEVDQDDINTTFKISQKLLIKLKKNNPVKLLVNPSGGTTAMTIGLYRAAIILNVGSANINWISR